VKEAFVFYWAEGNWNFKPLIRVHHVLFNIPSRTICIKVPYSLNVSNWNFVCIFNFCSAFLLSHLSHCLPVHSPPTFTHQYKSCSFLLCNFVHFPATSSVFRTNISLSPWSSTVFPCLVLWNTNTNTNHRTQFCVVATRDVTPTVPQICSASWGKNSDNTWSQHQGRTFC